MKGLTNAVATSGASGGDIIYAINNTGADITKGQKVWLNKHNLDESEAYQFKGGAQSTEYLAAFDNDDNFILYNNSTTSNNYYATYNATNKNWSLETLENSTSISSSAFMRLCNNLCICYPNSQISNNSSAWSGIIDRNRNIVYNGLFLGNGYEVSYLNQTTFMLEHNLETKNLTGFNGFLSTAIMLDNKIFAMDTNGNYKICSTNGDMQVEKNNTIFKSNNPIQHFTGLNPGDYVFYNTGKRQPDYEASSLNILQFDENYNFIEPTGLPEDLQALIGQNAFVQYYNDFDVLTVGTANNVYMFKFENGVFSNMNINIPLPTESAVHSSNGTYRLFVSQDMTSAVITYRKQTSSNLFFDSGFYKLKTLSDDWYADTYLQFSANTLTGIATGVTDLQKKYEVKTVLE